MSFYIQPKNIKYIFLLLVIAGLGFYLARYHSNIFEIITKIDPLLLFFLLILNAAFLVIQALIMKIALQLFNLNLSLSKCIGITALSSAGNSFTPQGGTLSKAVYLNRKHNFSYPEFLASMSAIQLLGLLIAGFLGLSIVLTTEVIPGQWKFHVASAFVIVTLSGVALLNTPPGLIKRKGSIFRLLIKISNGWETFRVSRGATIKISVLLLFGYVLGTIDNMVGFSIFSIKISLMQALLLEIVTTISFVVKITPANYGVQEVVLALTSSLLGIGFDEALVVASTLRIAGLIATTLSGGLLGLLATGKKS